MPVVKRSYSLDAHAAEYVERHAKRVKRSASAALSEIVLEAAQRDARDRVLLELGTDVEVPEKDVERWLKKLGAR